MAELTLNAKEAGNLIGCCSVKIYELAAQGKIPHIHIGRKLVFPKTALEKWLLDTAMAEVKEVVNELDPAPVIKISKRATRVHGEVWQNTPGCGGRRRKQEAR